MIARPSRAKHNLTKSVRRPNGFPHLNGQVCRKVDA